MEPITQPLLDVESIAQADAWMTKGESLLLKGCLSQGLSHFAKAEALIKDTQGEYYLRMGLALFEFGNEKGQERALLLASKKFKTAYCLCPTSAEILQAWAGALALLGQRTEEHHYFLSAKEKYEMALSLGAESVDLFWSYAAIWNRMALHSGEGCDYQKGLQFFKRAVNMGESLPIEFWIDYGTCARNLSTIIRDPRPVRRAIEAFQHAVAIDPSDFDAMGGLAEAFDALYTYTDDEDHFFQAHEAYASASKLSPQDAEIWLYWAQLLLKSAKKTGDAKRLRQSIDKCHQSYARDCEGGHLMATWAEALALLGQQTEQLDLMYEAENKINQALECAETDPALWHALGICMNALAHYFGDSEHHYLAIEKFQKGLSIDRTYDALWHEMANTYVRIGTLEGSAHLVTQALKFFEKAFYFSKTSERHIDCAKALAKLGEITQKKGWLKQALHHFETALAMQKNAIYLHPDWLFYYAITLDMMGEYYDDETYYTKAIDIFSHVFMVDPDFRRIHHHLAQAYSHLGELKHEVDPFYRAIHHLRLALRREEDNDALYLDWGIALINIAQLMPIFTRVDQVYADAKSKLTLAAKLGNPCAYYQLSCLFSLTRQYGESMFFLQKAHAFDALPPIEELLCDDWLDNLRSTAEFRQFVSQYPYLLGDR